MDQTNWKKGALSAKKEDMLEIAYACFHNASNLYNSAIDLENKNQFSLGVSLRVLSIEELMKSMVLILENKGFGIRHKMKGFDMFFTSHPFKLKKMSKLYFSVCFFQLIQKGEQMKVDPRSLTDELNALHELSEWIESADNIKQEGFYVGYLEKDKKLLTPAIHNEKNLENARVISGLLVRLLEKIFAEIEQAETIVFLHFVQTMFLKDEIN